MFFMNVQQIYDNFQEGDGPEGLTGGAAMVNEVAAGYEARAQQIHALVTRMESSWDGEASEAARHGAGPMSSEHELSGPALSTAQDLTNRQAESYSNAKNAVVPVPPEPVLLDPMLAMSSAGLTPYEDQLDAHNAAARNNVDAMNRYESASFGNLDGLPPSYGTFVDGTTEDPSGLSVSTGGGPGMGSGVIDSDDYKTSDDGDGADSSDPGLGPGGDTGGAVSGDQAPSPTGVGPVSPSDSGVTTPGGLTPGATPPGTPVIGSPDTGVGTGRPPGGGLTPGVGVFAGPGLGGGSGGSTGAGPGGGAGGPRGGGVAGPRGGVLGGPGAEPPGSTSRPGPAGTVTGAAGRGGAGMGGVPMGGAGKGRDGEDIERTRPPYLEGGDPDELFDTDVLTAPPTIGEDDDH